MCIAVYQSVGNSIDSEQFYNCWANNPDGGGFAYVTPTGEIKTEKYMKYEDMFANYQRALDKHGETSPFLVHFRIATHGSVSLANCHPFMVNDNQVMIHNGIIPVIMDRKDDRSDTRVFVDEYLPRLPSNWLDDEYLTDMVEGYIGSSKLAFLSTNTEYMGYILNSNHGTWTNEDGMWWSNASFKSCHVSSSPRWYSSAMTDNEPALGRCIMCAENSVYDGVCYECETCQGCSQEYDYCVCKREIHAMNDHAYMQSQVPF